jgi:replication factor A1
MTSGAEATASQEFKALFVPRSKIGERVRVRIRNVSGKFARAERVVQIEGIRMKINELRDGMKRINVTAKVTEKSDTREVTSRFKDQTLKVATAMIADETGTIKLTLWNEQISQVNVNDTVKIQNGYITSFRDEIQLNIGRYGTLTVE